MFVISIVMVMCIFVLGISICQFTITRNSRIPLLRDPDKVPLIPDGNPLLIAIVRTFEVVFVSALNPKLLNPKP